MSAATDFYRQVIGALARAEVPFLVGGAFALCRHVGMDRATKDLDLMICREDWPRAAQALRGHHIATRLVFPHWLGKAVAPQSQVDIIFNGGSGVTPVCRDWFVYATPARVLGFDVRLAAPEELLWSKAFVMERERFDGGDVLHLIRAFADVFDWKRLCRRFDGHEAILRTYLTLFRYAYPGEWDRVPAWVVPSLDAAIDADVAPPDLCRGTIISRAQFLVDVEEWGYLDARLPPFGRFTDRDWLRWTNAIDAKVSRIRRGRRRSVPKRATADRRRRTAD
jgi:hypothetical protein